MKVFSLLLLLGVLTSCGFLPSRSFEREMELDDQAFFEPSEDFPIVPGDRSGAGRGYSDIRRRTPMTETERMEYEQRRSLRQELRELESQMEDDEEILYKNFKSELTSESERIYFLKLKNRQEREDYIRSRGFDIENRPKSIQDYWEVQELAMGMSKNEVMKNWGNPLQVEVAGQSYLQNERWIYRRNGALKAIYFENGRVEGWSTQSKE